MRANSLMYELSNQKYLEAWWMDGSLSERDSTEFMFKWSGKKLCLGLCNISWVRKGKRVERGSLEAKQRSKIKRQSFLVKDSRKTFPFICCHVF